MDPDEGYQITGDVPPLGTPGEIALPDSLRSESLEEAVADLKRKRPAIFESAEKIGQDIIGFTTTHKKLLIGVGVAATALALGAKVIYDHSQNKKES